MNQNFELKLQSWLDGELSPAEARRVGQEIANDKDATLLVAELRSLKDAMAVGEFAMPVPESREFFWSKIQRQIEQEERAPRPVPVPRPAPWIRWLSPLAGVGALACITLLGFRPFTPPAFDEISSTGEGMEAVTFHDQSTGMTVVWLADSQDTQAPAQHLDSTETKKPVQDTTDSEVEME